MRKRGEEKDVEEKEVDPARARLLQDRSGLSDDCDMLKLSRIWRWTGRMGTQR